MYWLTEKQGKSSDTFLPFQTWLVLSCTLLNEALRVRCVEHDPGAPVDSEDLTGVEGGAVGPNLSKVDERLTPNYIYMHLKDPQRWGSSKVAPNYDLRDEEIDNLTKYLSNTN